MNDLVIMERQNIVDIADAIRNKTGVNDEMTLVDMVTSINEIELGSEELPSAEDAVFGADTSNIEFGFSINKGYLPSDHQYSYAYYLSTVYKAIQGVTLHGIRLFASYYRNYANVSVYLWNANSELIGQIDGINVSKQSYTDAYFSVPINIEAGEEFTISTTKMTYGAQLSSSLITMNNKIAFVRGNYDGSNNPPTSSPTSGKLYGIGCPIIGPLNTVEIPTEYHIERSTMDDIANEVKRITGTAHKISITQIQSGLESVVLQEKSVTPTAETQTIAPDSNYYGLSKVTVNPALLQEKTVTPTTEQQEIVPDTGYYGLSKVTVEAAAVSEGLPSAEEVAF